MEFENNRDYSNDLGVVGTIYEDEEQNNFELSPSSSSSSSYSSSSNPQWRRLSTTRYNSPTDVLVHVQDSTFHLHKAALIPWSTYLKRQLSRIPEITLSPPLNITAETFALVTDFCYGSDVAITPFNVAALRTAADLLGMTGEDNLVEKTEAYFRSAVAVSKESANIVLASCFSLLPEAETRAALVSRCIEAVSLMEEEEVEEDGDMTYLPLLEGVKNLAKEHLLIILDSVAQRFTDNHDLLYRIIHAYLQEKAESVSEEEKIQLCNYIDCTILPPKTLMHAVQNPLMPLRFIVQAMFIEQLNTRHSVIHHRNDQIISLGAILQRDQVSTIKSIMSATSSRINMLEEELSGMKKILTEGRRSASFRLSSESNKVERGQTGSISSLNYRDVAKRMEGRASSSSESSDGAAQRHPKLGMRLMKGLKSIFGLQRKKSDHGKVEVAD